MQDQTTSCRADTICSRDYGHTRVIDAIPNLAAYPGADLYADAMRRAANRLTWPGRTVRDEDTASEPR